MSVDACRIWSSLNNSIWNLPSARVAQMHRQSQRAPEQIKRNQWVPPRVPPINAIIRF